MFGAIADGEKAAVEFYNDWKKDVIDTVPEEKLLIYQVKDGWDPLCRFLGVETPSVPFPRLNDTKEVIKATKIIRQLCHLFWAGLVTAFVMLIYYVLICN